MISFIMVNNQKHDTFLVIDILMTVIFRHLEYRINSVHVF